MKTNPMKTNPKKKTAPKTREPKPKKFPLPKMGDPKGASNKEPRQRILTFLEDKNPAQKNLATWMVANPDWRVVSIAGDRKELIAIVERAVLAPAPTERPAESEDALDWIRKILEIGESEEPNQKSRKPIRQIFPPACSQNQMTHLYIPPGEHITIACPVHGHHTLLGTGPVLTLPREW